MRKLILILSGMFLMLVNVMAQTHAVSGKVTDDKGQPVAGVSVVVKGTKIGTSTNADGGFTLNVPVKSKTLVFSSINMATKEVAISGDNVSVSLAPKADELAGVVVTVPYGTVKKTAFTGSENTVTASVIQKQQVTSITKVLEGLIPGLVATNGGGAPGSDAAIRIRGIGSINASSAPLYVVNGTPFDGDISAISTDDIESVTVLKDAAASALYGSRAANGVIMINTKKGKKGKPNVSISLRQGVMSRGIPEYDRVDEKNYYELFWEAYKNNFSFNSPPFGETRSPGNRASDILIDGLVYNAYNVPKKNLVDSVTGKLNPNASLMWHESWEDALFRHAQRTNANLNISGASDNMDYFFSAGYLSEDGIVRNSGYKRYNFRTNVNATATKWFNVGVNIDAAVANRKDVPSGGTATTNPFYYSRQMGPIYPVYQHDTLTGAFVDSMGSHKYDFGVPEQMGTRPYAGRSNDRATLDLDDRSSELFNGNLSTYAEIKFLKYFSLKGTLGLNYYSDYATSYQNNQFGDAAPSSPGAPDGGRSTKTLQKLYSLTGNEVLSWRKAFSNHNVRALVGHENYKYKENVLQGNTAGFLFPGLTELDNGGVNGATFPRSYEENHRIESYFGNVNYDYKQKYLVSGSYRTDGSSRFAKHVRWGDFYSIGGGWRVTQERFVQDQNIKWLNDFKIRASYGEQGNENLGTANNLLYQYTDYYFNNGQGSYLGTGILANPDLLWESNAATNLGFDFAVLNNRLTGTIEWFNKESSNLLFLTPIDPVQGYSLGIYKNIGTMKNFGMELQLGYNVIRAKAFNWRVDLNLTRFKNEIVKLAPGKNTTDGIVTGTKKLFVGHGIFDFWLPEFAGVDASNGEALFSMDIIDASGKVTGKTTTNNYNNATSYFHGSALPKFSGGFTNSFNYKGFDLSCLVTFSYGGLFYDGNYAGLMHRGDPGIAWHTDILERWQKPGDITTVPKLQNGIGNNDGTSTRFLVDGSWLNIKNITLSYNLPKKFSKYSIGGMQVFVNVDNLKLYTAKKGMDPQRAFTGTSDASYTPFRTITAGFTVNLQ